MTQSFDAIVVGSGPGGATVARELSRQGWKVLILERGNKAPVTGSMAQTLRELWMPGRSLLVTDRFLAVLRAVTVGGSSIYFFGTAWEPAYELFDKRGVDIHAEVDEARRELSVAALPPELMGPKARRIMDSAMLSIVTAEVGRIDRLGSTGRAATIMVEIRDDLDGRITRRGGIRKPLSTADRQKLARGTERARRILANAGARRLYRSWVLAAQPGGTIPIGRLVDRDLQTEIPNLFVCDASVIPEPWGLPPSLTLIGLAKRLATHLVTGPHQLRGNEGSQTKAPRYGNDPAAQLELKAPEAAGAVRQPRRAAHPAGLTG